MDDPRVTVLDMTPFMCDRDKCFPVVGGALVHKDGGHVTQVFSRTLGPYLGRYVDRMLPPGARAPEALPRRRAPAGPHPLAVADLVLLGLQVAAGGPQRVAPRPAVDDPVAPVGLDEVGPRPALIVFHPWEA